MHALKESPEPRAKSRPYPMEKLPTAYKLQARNEQHDWMRHRTYNIPEHESSKGQRQDNNDYVLS